METVLGNDADTPEVFFPMGEESERLLCLFEQIAAAEGWQPGEQLRAFPEQSRYLAVRVAGDLAGGIQVVFREADRPLPYEAIWPEATVMMCGRVAEVTVLAITPEHRGRIHLFWPLCVELWRLCVAEQVEALILEATPRMLARYRRVGWPLEVVGELRIHWGEECHLCRMDLRTVAGSLLMQAPRSAVYRALVAQAARAISDAGCVPIPALA